MSGRNIVMAIFFVVLAGFTIFSRKTCEEREVFTQAQLPPVGDDGGGRFVVPLPDLSAPDAIVHTVFWCNEEYREMTVPSGLKASSHQLKLPEDAQIGYAVEGKNHVFLHFQGSGNPKTGMENRDWNHCVASVWFTLGRAECGLKRIERVLSFF